MIVVLYAVIGLLAAVGSVAIFRTVFNPEQEQQCLAAFLVPIAGFYLAFAAYFGAASSWRTETSAVLLFALLGLLGMRSRVALAIGYSLHGVWDVVHEVSAHGVLLGLAPGRLTEIPLAYGVDRPRRVGKRSARRRRRPRRPPVRGWIGTGSCFRLENRALWYSSRTTR